jgi:non-ribosomal peptide synthetase component E (peptide arylation enzyme)
MFHADGTAFLSYAEIQDLLVKERERADSATYLAEAEKQRAEAEKQRADRLAAKLRELGIEP